MKNKIRKISIISLCLLMVAVVFAVVPVNVSSVYDEDIYILGDGTISPPSAPISKNGNVYTLEDDVNCYIYIVNPEMVFDGGGHNIIGGGIFIWYWELYPISWLPHDVTIRNCVIGYAWGIDLWLSSRDITIENNTIHDCWCSISAVYGAKIYNLQVIDNTILHSPLYAPGGDGYITGNTITGSSIQVGVPYTISGNTLTGSGSGTGIYCGGDDCIISDNMISSYEKGIFVKGNTNIVTENMIQNGGTGIICEGDNNLITNNEVSNNDIGVYLDGAINNNINNNIIDGNNYGIKLQGSNLNQVWNNDFVDNLIQAQDLSGGNLFNLPEPIGGNYWSDYDGVDRGDGFGDTPYFFFGGQDDLPLNNSFKWTPTGSDVTVNPDPDVSVTFSNVLVEGITTVTTGSEIPGGDVNYLKFGDTYYDITTTATFSGDIKVCLSYDDTDMTPEQEAALQLIHWVNGVSTDVTCPGYPDTEENIICGIVPSLSWFCIAYPVTPVEIDIKPGSDPNSINLGAKGNVPVGILTTVDFDATTVDPGTVTLAGASVGLKGKSDKLMASIKDVNGDGVDDLLVHIDIEELALIEGSTIAALHGTTYDGEEVKGVDSVNIVPP